MEQKRIRLFYSSVAYVSLLLMKKLQKTDGLGPLEIKKIRSAIRLVWQRSHARALVSKRCVGAEGFWHCEKCLKKTPSIKIDHISPVGDVDGGFIERLFCPSFWLQGLCNECHKQKTRLECKKT